MNSLNALRKLGTGGEAPADAKQRVRAALLASLAAASVATTASGAASFGASPAAATPLIGGLTSAKAAVIAAGIWLVGGATGAVLYGALRAPEERVVYVERPVQAKSAIPKAESTLTPSANVTTPSSPMVISRAPTLPGAGVVSKRAAAAVASPGSDLARERALLDLARASAASGDPALVLEQTEQHRIRFPRGKLSEEREALAIVALRSLGRTDEARERARTFQRAHPNSMLLPVIDSALTAP